MENSARVLIEQLKNHFRENDGDVVYWGDPIAALPAAAIESHPAPSAAPSAPTKAQRLRQFREEAIGDCHLCPLGDTRIKLVFGVGNPEARVMFVGEGPGFDEDRKGEPFVGKAGQLLDRIMAAIGLNRDNVYIANIVKCHPMIDAGTPEKRGNDRAPQPPEIEKCLPFLLKQIEIIRPEIIVALGAVAARTLLGTTQGITSLRGRIVDIVLVDGLPPFPVLPTFHPAALLRDEALKKPVWDDMKLLRSKLAI
jgi:uracil-DNA glycosylase